MGAAMRSRLLIRIIVIVGCLQSSAVFGGKIYFADSDTGDIFRANLEGSQQELVLTSPSSTNDPAFIEAIAVDPLNRRIYWIDFADGTSRLQRASYDGSNIQTLAVVVPSRRYWSDVEVDVANNRVYWSLRGQVFRADLNGQNRVEITPEGARAITGLAIDADNNSLYYIDWHNQRIGRSNLDGGHSVILIDSWDHRDPDMLDTADIDIDLVHRKLYFSSEDYHNHFRSNLDGSGFEFLFNQPGCPFAVEVDPIGGFMYWTERTSGQVWRADLLGQNRAMLVDGLGRGAGVALDLVVPEPAAIVMFLPVLMMIALRGRKAKVAQTGR